MEQVKIIIAFVVAVLLQWTLRIVAEPFAYIEFPLIMVVYAALQRNAIRAIILSMLAGLSIDALSGGLLGANAFSKTLIAYTISEIVRRVYLDNLLLQIPLIAGACFLDNLVYYGLHRLFGQIPSSPVINTIAYSIIGTTIAGTIIFLILGNFSFEDLKRRRKRGDFFSPRRQTRRRNPIRLGRRG